MLKELVTSIFCCLPHHHDAPVVERITPISVVSQEPYSYGAFRRAVDDQDYRLAIELWAREVSHIHGQELLDNLDEYCEHFASQINQVQGINECLSQPSVLCGWKLINNRSVDDRAFFRALYNVALQTEDGGDYIKALYWWCVSETRHGYHEGYGAALLRKIEKKHG